MVRRSSYWDNVKFLLITFVVLGHFADYVSFSRMASATVLFIYSFHMPMFFLVSGLFLKYDDKHKLRIDKILYFIFIGYAMKTAIYFIDKVSGNDPKWYWLSENNVPWYMFVMAGYLILVYVLKSVSFKIVLPVSIVISLLAGYSDSIGNFLCLSRFIVFFPFFFLGYSFIPEKAQAFFKRKYIKIFGSLSLLILGVIFLRFNDEIAPIFRPAFYARFPYSEMPYPQYGILLRALQYFIAAAAICGMGAITPIKRIKFITAAGSRTIAIYAIHYFILRLFVALDIHMFLMERFSHFGAILWLILAVIVSCLLAIPLFNTIFLKLRQMISYFVERVERKFVRNKKL